MAIEQKEVYDVIRGVASKYNVPIVVAQRVYQSAFQFVAECIKFSHPWDGIWYNVRIIGWGVYYLKPKYQDAWKRKPENFSSPEREGYCCLAGSPTTDKYRRYRQRLKRDELKKD